MCIIQPYKHCCSSVAGRRKPGLYVCKQYCQLKLDHMTHVYAQTCTLLRQIEVVQNDGDRLLQVYHCFRGPCCSTIKAVIGAACTSKMSVNFY